MGLDLIGTVRCAALCLVLALWAAPLAAQGVGARDYERVIQDALTEFDTGNYAEAYALFQRAHELSPSARTLRGLGITSFELKRYVRAEDELSAALADKRRTLTKAQRDEVSSLLERTHNYIGRVEVELEPASASLLLDGHEVSDRRLRLELGDHQLAARAAGFQDATLRVHVDAGQTQQLKLALTPVDLQKGIAEASAAPAASPVTSPARKDEGTHPAIHRRWWFWTAIGVVVAAGAVTAVVLTTRDHSKAPEPGDVGGVISTLRVGQ
jgi:tetratricopeptide (TPR) repeat protein